MRLLNKRQIEHKTSLNLEIGFIYSDVDHLSENV